MAEDCLYRSVSLAAGSYLTHLPLGSSKQYNDFELGVRIAHFRGVNNICLSGGKGFTRHSVSGLIHYPLIRHLDVFATDFQMLRSVFSLPHLVTLKLAWLSNCDDYEVAVPSLPWINLVHLRSLQVGTDRLASVGAFDCISVLTNLEKLHLERCYPTIDCLKQLPGLTSLTLDTQDLYRCETMFELNARDGLLTALQALSQLQQLCLMNHHDCHYERVCFLTNLTVLRYYMIIPCLKILMTKS